MSGRYLARNSLAQTLDNPKEGACLVVTLQENLVALQETRIALQEIHIALQEIRIDFISQYQNSVSEMIGKSLRF